MVGILSGTVAVDYFVTALSVALVRAEFFLRRSAHTDLYGSDGGMVMGSTNEIDTRGIYGMPFDLSVHPMVGCGIWYIGGSGVAVVL
mmetsp:Transcript_10448/g.15371  ORF Transcript_10448/g.15371 Transcript_10448/m.15371 type:complete len:87 (-) Transcript_10448:395-655(-)